MTKHKCQQLNPRGHKYRFFDMFNIIFCDQKKTNIFLVAVGFNLISTPVHQILPPNKAGFHELT